MRPASYWLGWLDIKECAILFGLLRVKIKYSHTITHSSVKHTLRIVQDFPSLFWAIQCFWALQYANMTDFAINIITV